MHDKRSVLIVEDDPSQLAEYAIKLEKLGYLVHRAACAEDGIKVVRATHIDIILTDNVLPGMTGIRSIAELSKWSQAPVILMTSDWSADIEKDALLLGSRHCLKKPLDMPTLSQLLQNAVNTCMTKRNR